MCWWNASCTTVAPTGTLSILAECSAGIEPVYSLAYRRGALDGREFIQVHPLLERTAERGAHFVSAGENWTDGHADSGSTSPLLTTEAHRSNLAARVLAAPRKPI